MSLEGRIVDVDDPKKMGRVKVKLFNHNNSETKTKDLPWISVAGDLGAGQGQGHKPSFQKDQLVTCRKLNSSGTAIQVIGGSKSFDTDKGSGKEHTKLDNKNLTDSPHPDIASCDKKKLANTVFALINENLPKISMGLGGPDDKTQPPPEPASGWPLEPTTINIRKKDIKFIPRQFELYVNVSEYLKINKLILDPTGSKVPPPSKISTSDQIDIKIKDNDGKVQELNNLDVTGKNSDGTATNIKTSEHNIIFPGGIYYDTNVGYSEYTIYLIASHKKDPNNKIEIPVEFTVGDFSSTPY